MAKSAWAEIGYCDPSSRDDDEDQLDLPELTTSPPAGQELSPCTRNPKATSEGRTAASFAAAVPPYDIHLLHPL